MLGPQFGLKTLLVGWYFSTSTVASPHCSIQLITGKT
jgi:hypothetical protein